MKALKWILAGMGLFFGALLAASLYFYNLGVSRRTKSFLSNSSDLGDFSSTYGVDHTWLSAQALSEVDICSTDGLRLHAYYFPAEEPVTRDHTSRAVDDEVGGRWEWQQR